MSKFEMEFNKEFEKVVNDGLQEVARDMQRRMDSLSVELKGKSLDEAKQRLKQEWERDGGEITDPELTDYAQLLIEGGWIKFNAKDLRVR